MSKFKLGHIYRRKGFYYLAGATRAIDDTFIPHVDVIGVCSDCGRLYSFYVAESTFGKSHQRRRCDKCRHPGRRAQPWPNSEELLKKRCQLSAKPKIEEEFEF